MKQGRNSHYTTTSAVYQGGVHPGGSKDEQVLCHLYNPQQSLQKPRTAANTTLNSRFFKKRQLGGSGGCQGSRSGQHTTAGGRERDGPPKDMHMHAGVRAVTQGEEDFRGDHGGAEEEEGVLGVMVIEN